MKQQGIQSFKKETRVVSVVLQLGNLGFRYHEAVGGWRSPVDGRQLQKDVLFVKKRLFVESETETGADSGETREGTDRGMRDT